MSDWIKAHLPEGIGGLRSQLKEVNQLLLVAITQLEATDQSTEEEISMERIESIVPYLEPRPSGRG